MIRAIIILFVLFTCAQVLLGQERTPPSGKRQPSSRPIEIPTGDSEGKPTQEPQPPLPKIDLPEFVITGSVSLDPPEIEKASEDEKGIYERGAAENAPGQRERPTIDLGSRFKQSMFGSGPSPFNGSLQAAIGTFFSPNLSASIGLMDPAYDVSASASYQRTKGFKRYTDRSAGNLEAAGSLVLSSKADLLKQLRLELGGSYRADKYRFYGSREPSALRDLGEISLRLGALSGFESPVTYRMTLTYGSLSLRDSTAEAIENRIDLGLTTQLPWGAFPGEVRFRVQAGTVIKGLARNSSVIELGVGTPSFSSGQLTMQASLHAYIPRGMQGEGSALLYPHIGLGFRFGDHMLTASFEPRVEYSSLADHLTFNPYLSAVSSLRPSTHKIWLTLGVESRWTDWLMSKSVFTYQRVDNYPLYADSALSGIWNIAYAGETTIGMARIDLVANIGTNDYFGFALTARDNGNSITRTQVPFLPSLELGGSYHHKFPFSLTVSPVVSFVSARKTNVVASGSANPYVVIGVRTEYIGIERLNCFADIANLTDTAYDVFPGYRAEPLRVSLGISYHW